MGELIAFVCFLAALTILEICGFSHPVLWFVCGMAFIGTSFNITKPGEDPK